MSDRRCEPGLHKIPKTCHGSAQASQHLRKNVSRTSETLSQVQLERDASSDVLQKPSYPRLVQRAGVCHVSPPPLRGMFANFLILRIVCQLCQRIAKYAISVDNLNQKHIKRGCVCQFLGPHNAGKHTFLGVFKTKKTSVLVCPNLSGQLLS